MNCLCQPSTMGQGYMGQGYFPEEYLFPETAPATIDAILKRAQIVYPAMTAHDVEAFIGLYNWLIVQKSMNPYDQRQGATYWGDTMRAMEEYSNLPRAQVVAFLVAQWEVGERIVPDTSAWAYISAGAEGVVEGVVAGFNALPDVADVVADTLGGIGKVLKYSLIAGGVGLGLFVAFKILR